MKAGNQNLLAKDEMCTACGLPLLIAQVDENGDPKGLKLCDSCDEKLRRTRAEQRAGTKKQHDGWIDFKTLRFVPGGGR